MHETISSLTQRLTDAGFHVAPISDLPEEARNPSWLEVALYNAEPIVAAKDGGEAGAAQVTALIAAEKRLRDAGLTFAADKLKAAPVYFTAGNPNNVMSTGPQGVFINVNGVADVTGAMPLTGAPWSRVEAVEAVKAGADKSETEAAMLEGAAVHEAAHVLDFAASRAGDVMVFAHALRTAIKTPAAARQISDYAASSQDAEEASAEAISKAVYGRPLPTALKAWTARVMAYARHGGTF